MSSPFPQLLRRANIATYDPLITRIYTSTPSSKAQHADWGLKFPVHLPKGPRYIKFSSLDAGPGFNCDWRSAEREARFISAWGTGGVRWQNEDEIPKYTVKNTGIYQTEDLVEQEEGGEVWMRDVESMTEDDFEAFLERVRSERKRFLSQSLEGMAESTRASLQMPEDETLVHLATAGKISEGATATFQAQLTSDDLVDPHSTKINSRPHRVHGLNYSRAPSSSTDYNPISEKKGRALNKVNRADDAYSRAQAQTAGRAFGGMGGRDNLPWVVGLGGLTAKSQNARGRVNDSSSTQTIEETDYTRSDASRGVGRFRITRAQMEKPPTVLALAESRAGGQFGGKWRSSGATLPSPMDTFKFDIDVALASSLAEGSAASASEEERRAVGSRAWVGRERKLSALDRFSDDMGLGGPRKDRIRGEAADRLKQQEMRQQSKERVDLMLQRLKARRLAGTNSQQGQQ